EPWRFRPEQQFPHLGADAIGTDDDVGFGRRAIFENKLYCTARFLQVDQTMVKQNRFPRHGAFKHHMQVAAVDVDVGTAETPLAPAYEYFRIHRLAGVPRRADIGSRFEAGLHERRFNVETPQHLAHVGAEDDPGADP